MTLYQETLRQIISLLDALNAWEHSQLESDYQLNLPTPMDVTGASGEVVGQIADEIGGIWCFIPAGERSKE